MARCRFIVSDSEGPLRRFFTLDEAKRFMGEDPTLQLTILPRPKKETINLSSFEDALF
jgi:hypothetical protein